MIMQPIPIPLPILRGVKGRARAFRQDVGVAATAQERKVAALERMLLGRPKGHRMPRLDDLEPALAKIASVGQFGHITLAT